MYSGWIEGLEPEGTAQIRREPTRSPLAALRRLEATAAGCGWLLERWTTLRQRLEVGYNWRSHDRLRVVRLLGYSPLDADRDDQIATIYLACHAMNPTGPSVFVEPLAEVREARDTTAYAGRLAARESALAEPPDPEAGRRALLAIVAAAVSRLEALRDHHIACAPPAAAILVDPGGEWSCKLLEQTRMQQNRLWLGRSRVLEALRKVRQDFGAIEAELGLPSIAADDAASPAEPGRGRCRRPGGRDERSQRDRRRLRSACRRRAVAGRDEQSQR